MYPVLIQLGGFEVRSYGVVVAISFLLALWLSAREARRKGLDPAVVHDFAFYALFGGIVGARLYFVVLSRPGYFLQRPWEILAIWHGGLGILGGLFGGALVALWYCRSRRVSFWRLADVLAPGIILGLSTGILGCLATGDSYGRPTDVAWAITYTDPRALAPLGVALHPVELYEMAAYLLVFAVVWSLRKAHTADGFTFLVFLAGYGAARVLVEFYRGNPATLGFGIPAAQVIGAALVMMSGAGLVLFKQRRARHA
jgi:phosphatidylglycerol---prolipoprotein diacylglyceryl transferase